MRTDRDTVTITTAADGSYSITADETITVTVPVEALVSESTVITGSPTFDITNE